MEHKRRRNNLYIGEVFYLDAESKEVIASGYGQFDIDTADYQPMLKSIDSARRQIVHSEGYSGEFLLNLLTYTIVQMESDNKLSRPGGIIRKDSDVDKLYQLLRLMTVRYFNSTSEI